MSSSRPGRATLLLHPHAADGDPPRASGGSSLLLDRSSTFCLDGEAGEALASNAALRSHDVYSRFGTSTTRAVGEMVAVLEETDAALTFASGMAAISTVMRALVPSGGCLALADVAYGGTYAHAAKDLAERGVELRRFDATAPGSASALLAQGRRPDLVWFESIENPLCGVARTAEIAEACRSAGVLTAVDATFAAGMAQRPATLGVDLVVHSATKYLNGHSDVIAGVVAGSNELIDRVFDVQTRLGGCLDPQAAWLLARGMRTLPVRWARQCETAGRLARALDEHASVAQVYYPGLQAQASRDAGPLDDFGAMLAFECKDEATAERVVGSVRLVLHAASLGGTESLICWPRRTSHAKLSDEEGERVGIRPGLLRVSVGLEDFEDLWADLARGLG